MKTITLNRTTITNTVALVANYTPSTETEMNGKITFASNEDGMVISGTDYIETIVINNIKYYCDDLSDTFFTPFSIEAKKLLAVLKSAKTENISLEISEGTITVKSGRTKNKIKTISETFDFIISNMGQRIDLENGLLDSFKKISHAVDVNNPKYELNGMYMSSENGVLQIAATDTMKLSLITTSTKQSFSPVIIPKDSISSILKIFDGLSPTATADGTDLTIATESIVYQSKMINGKFPDYTRIIPKSYTQKISLDRKVLLELVKEATVFKDEIEINIADNEITIKDLEGDSFTIEKIKTENTNILFRINGKFVREFLSTFDDKKVQVCFNDKNMPVTLVANSSYQEVMMPILIKEGVKDENHAA